MKRLEVINQEQKELTETLGSYVKITQYMLYLMIFGYILSIALPDHYKPLGVAIVIFTALVNANYSKKANKINAQYRELTQEFLKEMKKEYDFEKQQNNGHNNSING